MVDFVKRLLAATCALLASGCASIGPYAHAPIAKHLARADAVGDCARLFRTVDERIDSLGVRDAQAPRVAGFPYLRVDRFTAGLRERALRLRGGFAPWSELMAGLDREARSYELANVTAVAAAAAADTTGAALPPWALLDSCRYQLAVADGEALPELALAADVPGDYSPALRALGIYPLTQLAFAAGIHGWQQRTRDVFAMPFEALPVQGRPRRYSPAGKPPLPRIDKSAAFELPLRSNAQWRELLARHAPLLAIDTVTSDDRIGALHWPAGDAAVGVDTAQPTAYLRVAFTHFDGRVLPQLVYTFWFPARPPEQPLDLLAGALDGLIWRVTLDRDFTPLVYDSIHPCGCYQQFFPTERVQARADVPQAGPFDEGLLAPQTVSVPREDQRVELRLAARSHYLQRVRVVDSAADDSSRYSLRDENELRALPLAGDGDPGTRSVYRPDALIAGSERLERLLFWPMGITSAGQMRQWGRHATAFVGKRHFDDADLLDRYFTRR